MFSVVLANGLFPTSPEPLKALRRAEAVYCCDGAVDKLASWMGDNADFRDHRLVLVGDGDSFQPHDLADLRAFFETRGCSLETHFESEQEYNDLTKTFRFVLSQGVGDVVFLGATGLREDHTLGNISLLTYYQSLLPVSGSQPPQPLTMITDHGVFTAIGADATFRSFPNQQVSLFSMAPHTELTVEGLQYPVEGRRFRQWWEGTLNAATGSEFAVRTTGPALVYQTHRAK